LKEGRALKEVVDHLTDRYADRKIDYILAAESRGFIFGSPLAYNLGVGFIPARKCGKLPRETVKVHYDIEYGKGCFEVHTDAISEGDRILVIDDLLAMGGTAKAMVELVEELGGDVEELAFVIELENLEGRKKLEGHNIYSMIKYDD
jgi:adenine phosphoribosyltransferase